MEKSRCFLAIPIDEIDTMEVYKELNKLGTKMTLVKPHQYHITVHFFGDITNNQIINIQNAINLVEFREFEITFKGLNYFPTKGKPRIIYIDTQKGRDELISLANTIQGILVENEFKLDRKKFKPHVTLSRIRDSYNIDKLKNLIMQYKNTEFPPQTVSSVKLYKSTLKHTGPEYDILHSFDFSNY